LEGCDAKVASGGGRMKVTMDRYEADWVGGLLRISTRPTLNVLLLLLLVLLLLVLPLVRAPV
jgi:hypothetical protein